MCVNDIIVVGVEFFYFFDYVVIGKNEFVKLE